MSLALTTAQNFDAQARYVARKLSRPLRLKEMRLLAGDHTGFAIDAPGSNGLVNLQSRDWLGEYDGLRIIGMGIDRTHLRGNWYGWTVFVNQHPGVIQFEEMTVHGWSSWGGAVHFGAQNTAHRPANPRFQLRLVNVKAVVDPPAAGAPRGKFCLFGYNRDEYFKGVIIDATEAREHGDYGHGASKWGSLWEDVEVWGAAAQPDKERADASETVWAGRDVWCIRKRVTYKNWHLPHSDRGGAALVRENGAANFLGEDLVFWGGRDLGGIPANARGHAVMISAEGGSYDILTGKVGVGFGNGMVCLRRVDAAGYSDSPWNSELISIYRNGGGKAARGVLIEDCGLWGNGSAGMEINVGDVPAGQTVIRGCNTQAIRERCGRRGMDVTREAELRLANRVALVSEGLVR